MKTLLVPQCFILGLFLLIAFGSQAQTALYPEFRYNGKSLNNLILYRIPDYGDGRRDGCIVADEMSLYLCNKDAVIEGQVRNVTSGLPLGHAMIEIRWRNLKKETIYADSIGHFRFKKSSMIKRLTVKYLTCRTLTIRGSRRKLF